MPWLYHCKIESLAAYRPPEPASQPASPLVPLGLVVVVQWPPQFPYVGAYIPATGRPVANYCNMVLSLEPQHYYRSRSSPSAILKIPTSIPTLGGGWGLGRG